MPRVSRATAAKLPPPPPSGPQSLPVFGARGEGLGPWDGTYISGGRIVLDHNADLPPSKWWGYGTATGICDQIPREDPVAQAIALAWALPVEGLTWQVHPATDDADGLAVAAVIRAALESVQGGIRSLVAKLTPYATRGFALIQPVLEYRDVVVSDAGSRKRRGAYVLDRVQAMGPNVISRWLPRVRSEWAVETVWPSGDIAPDIARKNLVLEPDALLRLAWRPENDAPAGLGLLRPCYGAWQQRRAYLRLELQGFERSAFGIPILRRGPTAREADNANAQAVVRDLRTGARAWAQLPDGYSLEFADFPMAASDIREARIAAGRDMARAALVQHIYTGDGNGTESLMGAQMDAAAIGWQTSADDIAGALSVLAARLTDANFGPLVEPPRVVHSRLITGGGGRLVAAIQAAAAGSFLTPGPEVEEMVRDILDLPEMPAETADAWERRIKRMDGPDVGTAPNPSTPSKSSDDGAKPTSLGLAESDPMGRFDGRRSGDSCSAGPNSRPLRPIERVVRLSETIGRSMGVRDAMAALVAEWRRSALPGYVDAVAAVSTRGLAAMAKVEPGGTADLAAALRRELRSAYSAGRASMESELDRQREDPALRASIASGSVEVRGSATAPILAGDHFRCCGLPRLLGLQVEATDAAELFADPKVRRRKPADARQLSIDEVDPDRAIRGVAQTTADAAASRVVTAAMSAIQSAGFAGLGLTAAEVAASVRDAVGGLSPGVDAAQGQADANAIFGLGRQQEARAEGVERFVYSNLLESQVCDPCAARDGDTFGAAELDTYATPASWCLGGDRCNCLVIGIVGEAG